MSVWVLIIVAFVAANLPWMTERLFLVFKPRGGTKRFWMRLVEWLVLYVLVGVFAAGLEMKITGDIHPQDWEFYVVVFCLFLIFALPGFIYRHELKSLLAKR